MLFALLLVLLPIFAAILFSAHEAKHRALAESQKAAAELVWQMQMHMRDTLFRSHRMLNALAAAPELRRTAPAGDCRHFLAGLLRLNPQISNIVVADTDGHVRCSARALGFYSDVAGEDYFRNALLARDFAVGGFRISPFTGKRTIFLAHKMTAETGTVTAVVAIGLDLGWLRETLLDTQLPPGAALGLIDSHGHLLANYHRNDQFARPLPASTWLAHLAGGSKNRAFPALWSTHGHRLTALLPLFPAASGGNLYLRLGLPAEAAYAKIDRIENRNLILAAMVALLALGLGWIAGDRLLLRRITDLAGAARRLASGDLEARPRLPPDSSELGELSGVFGTMGETLKMDEARLTRAGEDLRRANRGLALLSATNRTLVHADKEQTMLDEICLGIVRDGHYLLAFVGFARPGKDAALRVMAMAGDEVGYVENLDLLLEERATVPQPAVESLRTGTVTILRDLPADSRAIEWQDRAIAHRFGSIIALPITIDGKIMGALQICAAEADAFDVEEVKLLDELAEDLGFGISSLRHAEAHARVERELAYEHNYDSVTGLANRTLFQDRLNQALLQASRTDTLVAVMMLDLDRFKLVNESLGHAAGDALLSHVGLCLGASLRKGDTVARLSADEFAVLMSDLAKEEDVAPIARKLVAAVTQPLDFDRTTIRSSASMGISLFPKDGQSGESLIKNAASALHRAKSLGSGFRFYAPEMNERAAARFVMEGDLRRAMDDNELRMHFQPKVSLTTGKITGAEALARWRHPEIGMVPPGDFILLAEETGLIHALGTWVIEDVCRQLRGWLDRGLPILPVAINLSPHQFRQEDLASTVRLSLDRNGIDAGLIDLEITESALMHDLDAAIATMHELKRVGVRLSLDDFGTGYSSLSYLKRFPIDQLKIDRAFVRDLMTDSNDCEICNAVIGLAHNLGLKVVAEGVESEGQMSYLSQHGCDEMQGYYFSAALPASDFAQLLVAPRTLELPSPGVACSPETTADAIDGMLLGPPVRRIMRA